MKQLLFEAQTKPFSSLSIKTKVLIKAYKTACNLAQVTAPITPFLAHLVLATRFFLTFLFKNTLR